MMGLVPFKSRKRTRDQSFLSLGFLSLGHVRVQKEDSPLQAGRRALTKNLTMLASRS